MRQLQTCNSFLVELRGTRYGFSKVRGLKQSAEFISIREGGLNDYVHMLPAPAQQNGRIVFEQGWCGGQADFRVGSFVGECISIKVIGADGSDAGEFVIDNAIVESWELSDLDALESAVILKSLTLLHSGIREACNGSYI